MSTSWDLTKLFKTQDEFEKELAWIKDEAVPALLTFQGKLGTEEGLIGYLELNREIEKRGTLVYEYASLRSDLDKRNTTNAQDLARVRLVFNDLGANSSYADPEILALGKEYMDTFFKNHPDYKDFEFGFTKLFNQEQFVMSGEKELLMSNYSSLSRTGSNLYSALTVADGKAKKITLSDGSEVEVGQSNWTSLVEEAKCEEDRKAIFEALYSYYYDRRNAYGQIYAAVLDAQMAEMKSRGFGSILEELLLRNNIPTSVFLNLIDVASNNSAALKKYYEIKRKYLGLEKFRSYDRFIQLAKSEKKYTYEEAKATFIDSLNKYYSDDYKAKANKVISDGFVDVYPAPGKRSGAYSSGGGDVPPFILLNYNGGLDDVFTLAHEAGHSVHTSYSIEAQPVMNQGYTIFVAEIASTFNEHNLLDYFMEKGDISKQDKIFLLQKAIDEICATFYRQTLFGHYEYNISKKVENGEPIDHEVLSNEMTQLYKTYYGIDISEEIYKPLVWAYIPHLFYTPFYVYQYATSYTASMLIYENVKNGKEGAFDSFVNMLKKGGSEYPIDEVKAAGVDLTTKEPFLAVTRRMEYLVDELEKLLTE